MNDLPAPAPATEHCWPWRALVRDYLLAGAGLAVCFPPLLFVEWTVSVVVILGGLSALFGWLALRTLARQRAVVRATDDAIARNGRVIAWNALSSVTLRRFGAGRGGGGTMEMTIAGGDGRRIGIDSQISDFLPLARRIFAKARAQGIAIDERTRAAFAALGLRS